MGPSYPSGRILSNVASDKRQVPLATHSMEGSGPGGCGGWCGGGRERGQEDSRLAESSAHIGSVFCDNNLCL